jgi:hypothetical protein
MKKFSLLGFFAVVLAFSGPSYSLDCFSPLVHGKAQSAKLVRPGSKATVLPKTTREYGDCQSECRYPSTQKQCCLCQEGVWKCSDGRCSCYFY